MLLEIINTDIKIKNGFFTDKHKHSVMLSDLPLNVQLKITGYKNINDNNLRLLGKVLLRNILLENGYSELSSLAKLQYFDNQKPRLDGINFSISYSTDLAVVAISKKYNIGIDIEKILPVNYLDFSSHFGKKELNLLKETTGILFFKLWTRKEALSKATGKGVFLDFDAVNVISDEIEYEGKKYKFENLEIAPGYLCSLCFANSNDILEH